MLSTNRNNESSHQSKETGGTALSAAHEEVILADKEGQEFHPHFHTQGSLQLIKQISTLAILLSTYQIIPNGLSAMISRTPYNISSIILTIISLILSIALYFWANKLLDAEQSQTLLTTELTNKTWKRINTSLFLSLLIRAAISPALILNMLLQNNQTREELIEYGQSSGETSYITFAKGLSGLTVPLPLFEIMIAVTFLTASRTCFNYFKEPAHAMARLTLSGNTIMAASSLGLLFAVFQVRTFHYSSEFSSLYPSWMLDSLFGLSITAVVTSFAVWLVNFKRWRGPSLFTSFLLFSTILALAVLGSSSYNNTRAIEGEYGRANSKPFLALSNFAMISATFGALALIGNIYLIQNPEQSSTTNPRRAFNGLYILIAFIFFFAFARIFYLKPYSNDSHLIVTQPGDGKIIEQPATLVLKEQPKVQDWLLDFSDKLANLSRELESTANSIHETKGLFEKTQNLRGQSQESTTDPVLLANKLSELNSQLKSASQQVKETKDLFLAEHNKDLVPEQMINSLWSDSLDNDISEYQSWLANTQTTELFSFPLSAELANMATQLKSSASQLVQVSGLLEGAYKKSRSSIEEAKNQAKQAEQALAQETLKAQQAFNQAAAATTQNVYSGVNQTVSTLGNVTSNVTSGVYSGVNKTASTVGNIASNIASGVSSVSSNLIPSSSTTTKGTTGTTTNSTVVNKISTLSFGQPGL